MRRMFGASKALFILFVLLIVFYFATRCGEIRMGEHEPNVTVIGTVGNVDWVCR